MIVFLTLLYIGVLAILLKLKVIKLTLWWKLSPIAWMVLLLVVLFIPMQWGAPSGPVTMFQQVVEVIPNVTGEVIEVSSKPLSPMEEGEVIFKIDPRTFEYKVRQIQASRDVTKINLDRAINLAKRDFASQFDVDRLTAELKGLEAQLDEANYNLEQTIVRTPGKGFIIALTLRPGQRVANLPIRSWVAYVKEDDTVLSVGINQIMLRHIKIGDEAEVALKLIPGKILKGKVKNIAYMTPQGQVQPSGLVPPAPTGQEPPQPYGVLIELDETDKIKEILRLYQVPGGAVGTAAIYTKSVKMTHIIRKVMIRMDAWMNYIIPY